MADSESAQHSEGTIRFAYALSDPAGPVADPMLLDTLQAWRTVLRRLGLLGQERGRYGGFAFGNLSARDPDRPEQIIITASQTSGNSGLEDADLVRLTHCNPERFWVEAEGHQPPSSESVTHAMVYRADRAVNWVFHVHSPDIWRRAEALALPSTSADVAYGSPAMADAVAAVLARHPERPMGFVTLGHEDGVFACGASAADAGTTLVRLLAGALCWNP